jgi:hypothetical protein
MNLINGQIKSFGERIEIQADNFGNVFSENRIRRKFDDLTSVEHQCKSTSDLRNSSTTQPEQMGRERVFQYVESFGIASKLTLRTCSIFASLNSKRHTKLRFMALAIETRIHKRAEAYVCVYS